MIISKTPYRISFFGGGSDYPNWYNNYSGSVLSTTIDKHIYITCRHLPNFFNHKFRIIWSKLESVKKINQIKHNAVRNLLKELNIKKGLEIHYDGDLPARSGMGSSSCFVVGLSNVLFNFLNIKKNKKQLYKFAINFEHKILKEVVGSQDQVAVVNGGFNRINFFKNKIQIKKINNKKNLSKLNKNLMLVYSGIQRNAPDIAKKYINTLTSKNKKSIYKLIEQVELGEKISNFKIDEIYREAKKCGALGGKLLGAGGGGFMLFYIKENKKKNFLKKNRKLLNIPFKFTDNGSEIIFNYNNDL